MLKQKSRVLCLSNDPHLLRTRQWILATRYDAVSVASLRAMEELDAAVEFDVVILCHALEPAVCTAAALVARRRWPQAKIVTLATESGGCGVASSDRVVFTKDGPAALLRVLSEVVAGDDELISRSLSLR